MFIIIIIIIIIIITILQNMIITDIIFNLLDIRFEYLIDL
jgi:hypothetical protein